MPAKEVHELEFERSDGDETVWPSNTKRIIDSDGHVNYMQPVGINDEWGVRWRKSIGSALAVHLNLPDGPDYILKDWPEGYHMFVHHKGPENNPRTDKYIFGSRTVSRFRSIPEFVPHALWLMKDPTLNRENCYCKYCSKTPQRNITESFGLSSQGTPGAFGTSRHSVLRPTKLEREPREKLEIAARPYAAVRRTPKPVKLTAGPKQSVAKERHSDLRATASRFKRWYREGELLWCSIKPIKPAGRNESSNILFWPGIVEECLLKISLPADGGVQIGNSTGAEKFYSTSTLSSDNPASRKIKQLGFYRVSLLALKTTYRIPDYEVLPYQAYGPNPDLLEALRLELAEFQKPPTHSPSAHFFEHPSEYDEQSGARFKVAAAPFSLAIQIAGSLASYWTATDDWEFRFSIPPAVNLTAPPDQSLSTAISSSFSNNRNEPKSASARGITGPMRNMSRDRLQSVSNRLLGSQPVSTSVSQSFTQKRYQGLWWGAERIWTDELVRLKVARKQIAPGGSDQIFPPAGPAKSALDAAASVGGAMSNELGAGERGVFMKMESLFVVDLPQGDGRSSELRASGMLYEIVDADWEGVGVEEPPSEDKIFVIDGVGESSTFNSSNSDPVLKNGTSKLGAQLLPNPDPTVPITETTSDMVSKTLPNRAPTVKTRSPNSQLSNPGMNCPLPAPPSGFKFRAILPQGCEAVVSLPLISGRYYPGLLRNPLMRPFISKAFGPPLDPAKLASSNHIWALEGLCPGYHNSVDPSIWRKSRQEMVKAADQDARGIIENYYRQKDTETSTGDEDVEMMSVENMI